MGRSIRFYSAINDCFGMTQVRVTENRRICPTFLRFASPRDVVSERCPGLSGIDVRMRHLLVQSAKVFFRQMPISLSAIQKLFRLLYTLMRHFDNRCDHEERLLNRSLVSVRHRQSCVRQTISGISACYPTAMFPHRVATTACGQCKLILVERLSSAVA
jgi:hypothetical protein